MKILVTGGAGYVGSHACKALVRSGHTPICYDNLDRGHEWAVKWGPLERGDLGDAARLREVLRKHQPAAVMHFAAYALAGESVERPELYRSNNVDGTAALLGAMREAGVRDLVFSGSCAVYGEGVASPISESAAKGPVSPYGVSKLRCEELLADAGREWGLRSVSLRYFNACGADADGEIGEVHDPETHLVPLVLQVAAGRRPHIEVFGSDYPTPDGTCVRDYIHVEDLAAAHVAALEKMVTVTNFGAGKMGTDENGDCHHFSAYNLGTGRGHSVLEVIEAARRVTGHPIPAVMRPRRPGDPAVAYADASLARRELGWQARHTDLDAIIASAWKWACRT